MNILLFGTLAAGVVLVLAGLGLRRLFDESGARRVVSRRSISPTATYALGVTAGAGTRGPLKSLRHGADTLSRCGSSLRAHRTAE